LRRRYLLLIIVALILFSGSLFAESEEKVYKTSYQCLDMKADKRWQAEAQITNSPDKENIYILTEKGSGIYSGFSGKISWEASLEFESTEDMVRPLKMEKQTFDKKGEIIEIESQEFDFANKKAYYRCERPGKDDIIKKYNFKGDIVNRLILGLYIQKFLESGKRKQKTYMLSSEPQLYKVDIKILDTERIEVSNKERSAYKICLDPDIGLLNIFKIVLPKAYVWHSAYPEYEWLMYKGPESSVSSPKVEIVTLD
jgi:hypothetical protein